MIVCQRCQLLVGHGSLMNAIEDNEYSRTWRSIAERDTQTRGNYINISPLAYKGHQNYERGVPKTIYDMYGFPDELYKVKYNPPDHRE